MKHLYGLILLLPLLNACGSKNSDHSSLESLRTIGTSTLRRPDEVPQGTSAIPCHKASEFVCKIEFYTTEKTNEYRKTVGLGPLKHDEKIAFVSRDWSDQQARMGNISHGGFPTSRQAVYQREFSEARAMYAENVLYNYVNVTDTSDENARAIANTITTVWWNSSGHRANMMGRYSNLGNGVTLLQDGRIFATQIFN